jgi:hypothetical protein
LGESNTMTQSQELLVTLGKQHNLTDFVETGTQAGNTFRAVRGSFDRAFTIDLGDPATDYVESEKFFFFYGSSGDRLGEILQAHNVTRALFWLDAHGNQTWYKDDGNNQVPKELEAIALYAPTSLVAIDDITYEHGEYWVNDSYRFVIPEGWHVEYDLPKRVAILHR